MVVTFYSFKGGVGRSMALVNVAEMLADAGYKVIVCDWDLEAPGIERYFFDERAQALEQRAFPGVIDLLLEYKATLAQAQAASASEAQRQDFIKVSSDGPSLRNPASYAKPVSSLQRSSGGWIKLLSAGRRDGEWNLRYTDAVRDFNWSEFYDTWAGDAYLDFLRKQLQAAADVVLIDSRTGVTEAGGVCTHHLPDLVLLFSAANDQNIEGTRWMADVLEKPSLKERRGGRELAIFPIPSRIERSSETDYLTVFRNRFEADFSRYLPEQLANLGTFIKEAEIPYIPKYSFSESIVARQPPGDRLRELSWPYEFITESIVSWGCERKLLEPRGPGAISARAAGETPRVTAAIPKGQFVVVSLGAEERGRALADELRAAGLDVWNERDPVPMTGVPVSPYQTAIERSAGCLVLVSPSCDERRIMAEINSVLSWQAQKDGYRGLLLLEPGAEKLETQLPLLRRLPRMEIPPQFTAGSIAKIIASLLPDPVLIPELDGDDIREKLRANAEAQSRFFLGRETEFTHLLAGLRGALESGGKPIVISGAAGEGKTALIQGGLVPALRRGVIGPNRRPWQVLNVVLADDALADTAAALRQLRPGATAPASQAESISTPASADPTTEIPAMLRESASAEQPLALLFDGVENMALRRGWEGSSVESFLSLLQILASNRTPNVLVVISIRSSFLEPLMERTRDIFDRRDVFTLERMTPDGMKIFLEGAARLLGVRFEAGLVERILTDTLRAAVTSRSLRVLLWRLSQSPRGNLLTHEAYAALGGIEGVTLQDVGRTLSRITGAPLAPTRTVVTSLIQVRTGARLALPRETLLDLIGRGEGAEEAVVQLFDWNVLTLTDNGAVTLSSDAIPKLEIVQQWLREDYERLKLQSDLDELARKWDESGRPNNLLPAGDMLKRYRNVPASSAVTKSLLLAAAKAELKHKRRTVALGLGIIFSALLAVVAAGYGFYQLVHSRERLQAEKARAERALGLAEYTTMQAERAAQELSTLRSKNEQLILTNAELNARLKTGSSQTNPLQHNAGLSNKADYEGDQKIASANAQMAQAPLPNTANTASEPNAANTKFPPRIYFESGSPAGADLSRKLESELKKAGYSVEISKEEKGESLGWSEVKYYFPEDASEAARLIEKLQSLGVDNVRGQARQILGPKGARPRHFDVWIEPGRPAPKAR